MHFNIIHVLHLYEVRWKFRLYKKQEFVTAAFHQLSISSTTVCISCMWGNNHNQFLNTLRPRQNGRHFADDIFKCILLNENTSILINISLKFVPEGRINNIPALVQIMAWRRLGDKPLSEPMMVSLLTHKCVTRLNELNSFLFFQ